MSAEGRSPAQMLCTSSGTPHAIALPVGLAKLRGGGNPILPATAVTEVLSSLGRRAHRRRLRPRPGRRRGAAARRDRGHRRDRAAVPARDHGPARRRRRLGAADHPGRRHRRRAEHPGVSAGHRCRVQRPLPMLSRSVKPAGFSRAILLTMPRFGTPHASQVPNIMTLRTTAKTRSAA